MRNPVKINESHVQRAICDFLRAHGWRIVRTQFSFIAGAMQTGEPGMPDVIALYPLRNPNNYAAALTFWLEFKNPNGRMVCRCEPGKLCRQHKQEAWQKRERQRGFIVWANVNDVQWFIESYYQKFSWLHSGETASGQLDLLMEKKA